MSKTEDEKRWVFFQVSLSEWFYLNRVVVWAKQNGMTIRGAIRHMIYEFFKDKDSY